MAVKKSSDDVYVSDTGNWNDAKGYSRKKIHDLLILCDHYERIAFFGSDSIVEELINYGVSSDLMQYRGFIRLVRELILLIDNTRFSMKKQKTEEQMQQYRKVLKTILDHSPKRYFEQTTDHKNNKKSVIIKDRKGYYEMLEKVSEIKSLMNIPLNRNHLIFVDREEFDPKAWKDRIKQRITEKG